MIKVSFAEKNKKKTANERHSPKTNKFSILEGLSPKTLPSAFILHTWSKNSQSAYTYMYINGRL